MLLVIDGNTGQNALMQVRAFDDALQLTGLIITKLDGTAKGGVIAAIARNGPFRCTSSAWAKSSKTWKPSTPASLLQALLGWDETRPQKPAPAEPKRRNHVALALMQRTGGGKHAPSPATGAAPAGPGGRSSRFKRQLRV